MRRLVMSIAMATLCAASWSPVARAESYAPEAVRIELDAKKSRKPPTEKKAKSANDRSWRKSCRRLGRAVTVGKGPWGFGAFAEFSCYRDDKRLSGDTTDEAWTITVVDGLKEASFALTRKVGDETREIARVTLPPSDALFDFLSDDEFVDLISFSLLDGMAQGMFIDKSMLKGSPASIVGRHWRAGNAKDFKYDVPSPPEELILYRLKWNSAQEIWISDVIGTLKRTKITKPKKRKKAKSTILIGGSVAYSVTPEIQDALNAGPLWAHDAKGPGKRHGEVANALKAARQKLDAAVESGSLLGFLRGTVTNVFASLFDSAASGYVGLRYGLQVLPGDTLLEKTSMFGLLVEIRGGPVKGLRYYYDKLPRATAEKAGEDGEKGNTNITWARHVLGFSWDFSPGLLVDRLTVDPKLGMWDFNATLATSQDASGRLNTETFDLGRTFSTALEVGLEILRDWYTLRAWYAIDTGFSLLKKGGKVTSSRFGADAYFTAGPTFSLLGAPLKTALLGFYVYEAVQLTSGDKAGPELGEEKITAIPYSAGYAGGGVAISW